MSACARNLPQHFNGCTCTVDPSMSAEATFVELTAAASAQDPATSARYKIVEESQDILERDVCDPLEEEFGDEEAPDTTTLRDYLGDAWYAFDNANGTTDAMYAYAEHIDKAEQHIWNTANDAPGGGPDEMNGHRGAAREDYWDAKARDSITSLRQEAARVRAAADQHADAAYTGSGWGTHRPTEVVDRLHRVRVGDVLAEQDEQFGSRNLFLVTSRDLTRGVIHGHYVNLIDTSQKRLVDDIDQARWDFEIEKGEMSFTDVRGHANDLTGEQRTDQPDTVTT